ncbi:MAG: DoxX family protein [Candidatus Binatia bacterium]|nr:DoxX family protein [Candidatus Binatia bacterium]MDG2011182.1 DoxX family protein [Candidatus Binatia bacterium]
MPSVESIYQVAKVLSLTLFLFYGLSCLFADAMVEEFRRFGLADFRRLTGSLEVLGALGLIVGYFYPPLVPWAAGGLALLMLLGVGARVRVNDPVFEILPAAFLLVVNAFIAWYASGRGS